MWNLSGCCETIVGAAPKEKGISGKMYAIFFFFFGAVPTAVSPDVLGGLKVLVSRESFPHRTVGRRPRRSTWAALFIPWRSSP